MYKRRIFELLLERVQIDVVGGRKTRGSKHVLSASLTWPRPAIAERFAVKTLDFENNTADLSKSDWTARILFKETVQGPFGLEVSVTEPLSTGQAGEFLKFMGLSILKLARAGAGDLAASPIGSGLIKLPFEYLGKIASSSDKKPPRLIGAGKVDLSADDKWKAGKLVRIEIPLTAPETIYKTVRSRKHGELSARRRTLLKAGQPNGTAVLSARLYD